MCPPAYAALAGKLPAQRDSFNTILSLEINSDGGNEESP